MRPKEPMIKRFEARLPEEMYYKMLKKIGDNDVAHYLRQLVADDLNIPYTSSRVTYEDIRNILYIWHKEHPTIVEISKRLGISTWKINQIIDQHFHEEKHCNWGINSDRMLKNS